MESQVVPAAPAAAAVATKPRTVFDVVTSMKDQLALALPRHIPVDRMLRVVVTALRRTPKLQQCHQASLLGSIMTCGQLGLEPNDPRGLAYLIPYKDECQLIIGYRGYIELAMRSGMVKGIQALAVYARDHFEYEEGLDPKLVHRPYMGAEEPGEVVAAYAIATMPNDVKAVAVLPRRDIERARQASSAVKSGRPSPWDDWYPEMAVKTAIRRLAKRMPQSPEFAHAIEADGAQIRLNLDTQEVQLEPADEQDEPESEPTANATKPALADRMAVKAGGPAAATAPAPSAAPKATRAGTPKMASATAQPASAPATPTEAYLAGMEMEGREPGEDR